MSTIVEDNTADDTAEFNRLVALTVLAIRQNLGITVAELAKASGVPRSSVEAIERGDASTRADRHDIAVAVSWLSNHCAAKRLTSQAQPVPRIEGA